MRTHMMPALNSSRWLMWHRVFFHQTTQGETCDLWWVWSDGQRGMDETLSLQTHRPIPPFQFENTSFPSQSMFWKQPPQVSQCHRGTDVTAQPLCHRLMRHMLKWSPELDQNEPELVRTAVTLLTTWKLVFPFHSKTTAFFFKGYKKTEWMPFEVGTWNSSSVAQGMTLIQMYSVVSGAACTAFIFSSIGWRSASIQ